MSIITPINNTDIVKNAPAVLDANFSNLNTDKLETLTNVGSGTGILVQAKSGNNVPVKSILGGSNVTITNNANEVQIDVSASNPDASTTVKGLGRLSASPNVVLGNPTITIATPAVVTLSAHGLIAGDSVVFSTTGSLPTGITAATVYFVIASGLTSNAFEIATVAGGSALNTSGSQSGTHTVTRVTPVVMSAADPILTTQSGTPLNGSSNKILDTLATIFPAGMITHYGGSSAPTGWVLCDGSAISRSTFSALFAILSTTYGTGDGTTTFNVPDLRGRVPVGAGTGTGGGASGSGLPTGGSALTAVSRGTWKGEETHQLTVPELASHTHTINGNASTGTGVSQGTTGGGTIATSSTGSDTPHNNIQPVMGVNFIIKT